MPPHASRYLPSSGSEPPIPDAAAAPRLALVVVETSSQWPEAAGPRERQQAHGRGSRPTGEAAGPRERRQAHGRGGLPSAAHRDGRDLPHGRPAPRETAPRLCAGDVFRDYLGEPPPPRPARLLCPPHLACPPCPCPASPALSHPPCTSPLPLPTLPLPTLPPCPPRRCSRRLVSPLISTLPALSQTGTHTGPTQTSISSPEI